MAQIAKNINIAIDRLSDQARPKYYQLGLFFQINFLWNASRDQRIKTKTFRGSTEILKNQA